MWSNPRYCILDYTALAKLIGIMKSYNRDEKSYEQIVLPCCAWVLPYLWGTFILVDLKSPILLLISIVISLSSSKQICEKKKHSSWPDHPAAEPWLLTGYVEIYHESRAWLASSKSISFLPSHGGSINGSLNCCFCQSLIPLEFIWSITARGQQISAHWYRYE